RKKLVENGVRDALETVGEDRSVTCDERRRLSAQTSTLKLRADWVVQASEEHIRVLESESDDAFARPRRPSWAERFRDTFEGDLLGTLDAVALLQSDLRDCFGRAVEPRDRVVETPLILSAFRVRQQV